MHLEFVLAKIEQENDMACDQDLANLITRTFNVMNRCHSLVIRHFSKKYSGTLNLPQTKFLLSMKDGVTPKREKQVKKACSFDNLYEWQQQQQRSNEFVLHDGPPYANGKTHVGHALNKILKDITNRYKLLCGFKVHYVPGWDCHGTPIEQKVLNDMRTDHRSMDSMEIREKARIYAEKSIKQQKKSFQDWGIMADWKKQCYFSFDKNFEANQLDVFYKMFEKGLVYQDYMPVFWSPSSGTALAEAELEYNDKHVSNSVYVKMPLRHVSNKLQSHLGNYKAFLLIWTTTPWTLPSNKAVCYGENIKYSLVKPEDKKEAYVISTDFIEKCSSLIGAKLEVLTTFSGSELESSTYSLPFPTLNPSADLPVLPSNHVTTEKGTGLVHTAPAHGPEDFQVAVNHKLPMECHVDIDGCFMKSLGEPFSGKAVLTEGNKLVLELLKDNIVFQEEYEHSYPYDWRSKQPVIYRACKQWFVNTAQIKEKAIESLKNVKILPKASENGMLAQLSARTYWCISRQRAWGVPIPAFYHSETNDVLMNRYSIEHIKSLVQQHGSDCWWKLSIDELLPSEIKEKSGFKAEDKFSKGDDVLDIWFDSGTTWATVLKDHNHSCDVYLEGLDQFGGWFQSSLLTSVAVQDKPPYRSLVVHGFTMDEEGRKMSKSVGNVVDPDTVIYGGKDKEKNPAYGTDVLRLWTAQAGLEPRVNIGPTVLQKCNQLLFKFRKTLRYLMSNLYDFDMKTDCLFYQDLLPQDKYMLHLLHQFIHQVQESYDDYNYSRVVQLCEKFNNVQVSGFYSHITKDRMYCSPSHSIQRRSCQTVQYYVLESLIKCLAPVVPHFCEEFYQYPPFKGASDSLFKTSWFSPEPSWQNEAWNQTFDLAFSIRDSFYQSIGAENPVEFDLVVCAKPKLFNQIKKLQDTELTSSYSPLCEVLQCSTVSLLSRPPLVIPDESQPVEAVCMLHNYDGTQEECKYLLVILPAEDYICERCRRFTAQRYAQPCQRCLDVMSTGWE